MALLIGLLVGYVLAIPPGPIGMAAIRYGMLGRMRDAVHLAAGAGVLDLVYCLIAMWTSAGLLDAVLPHQHSGQHQSAIATAQVVIAATMIIAGVLVMRSSSANPRGIGDDDPSRITKTSRWKGLAPFMTGVGFAVTNLANPTFVPSLMVMTGTIRSAGLVGLATQETMLFSVGFGAGNMLWLITLGLLTLRYRHRVSDRILIVIRRVMALMLIIAGAYFGLRAGLGALQ